MRSSRPTEYIYGWLRAGTGKTPTDPTSSVTTLSSPIAYFHLSATLLQIKQRYLRDRRGGEGGSSQKPRRCPPRIVHTDVSEAEKSHRAFAMGTNILNDDFQFGLVVTAAAVPI